MQSNTFAVCVCQFQPNVGDTKKCNNTYITILNKENRGGQQLPLQRILKYRCQ